MDNGTNSTNGTFEGFQNTSAPKSFWANLLLPLVYLVILIGSFATFSSLYRQRQNAKAAKLENWFPPHRQRDIYLSLLHLDPAEASQSNDSDKKLSKVPDSVLKAALLERALEDIKRIVILRTSKPPLQTLLQRGSVGDELWQRFQRAEKEMEEEVKDVVNEANAFTPGWGQIIFQSANEMNQNRLIRERIAEIEAKVETEKKWWEDKRAGISQQFMKELDDEEKQEKGKADEAEQDDDAVVVESGGPSNGHGSIKKKKSKK